MAAKSTKRRALKAIYACDADFEYATGLRFAPDPQFWFGLPDGTSVLPAYALDIGAMQAEAVVDQVIAAEGLSAEASKMFDQPGVAEIIGVMAKRHKASVIEVPASFPSTVYAQLVNLGFKVAVVQPFFPEREIKTAEEIEALAHAQRCNEWVFVRAVEVLQRTKIGKNNVLYYQNRPLTAERLRAFMNKEAMKRGGGMAVAGGPIIACGAQGANPHERGSGPLKAYELIVIDSFHRYPSGYWSDMTRTFVVTKNAKDDAWRWQHDMYNVVKQAQELVEELVCAGNNAQKIDQVVASLFEQEGYPTDSSVPHGYIHSLGHGVGLHIHEAPPVSRNRKHVLREGEVVTNEPGLYYNGYKADPDDDNQPLVGGVRIEDMLVVTKNGCRSLNVFPKILDVHQIDLEAVKADLKAK